MRSKVAESATGYTVTFHEEDLEGPAYITFDVTYIERMQWGLMTTLKVKSPLAHQAASPDGTCYISRVNLMKGRERSDIARRLDSKLAAPRSAAKQDWEAHLERVAGLIEYEMEKPHPTVDLIDRPLPQRQGFLLPGLLATGKTNVLFGPGGTGKSMLATRIATSIVTGVEALGLHPTSTGEVLYLDWEDEEGTMVERLESVCKGIGIDRITFKYLSLMGKGPYERHHAGLKQALMDHPKKLVVIDSVAMAMHGGGEGADGAIRFFGLLNELPATRLVIDHLSSDDVKEEDKNGRQKAPRKPYGSVFKTNIARNMWAAMPWDHGDGLTLMHTKSNVGRKQQDIDVSIEWGTDQVSFVAL